VDAIGDGAAQTFDCLIQKLLQAANRASLWAKRLHDSKHSSLLMPHARGSTAACAGIQNTSNATRKLCFQY
jgi:hypothetical protein